MMRTAIKNAYRESSPNISTSKCGLVVSVANQWLGASPWLGVSPNGLVNDPTSDPPDGLVEFKIHIHQGI